MTSKCKKSYINEAPKGVYTLLEGMHLLALRLGYMQYESVEGDNLAMKIINIATNGSYYAPCVGTHFWVTHSHADEEMDGCDMYGMSMTHKAVNKEWSRFLRMKKCMRCECSHQTEHMKPYCDDCYDAVASEQDYFLSFGVPYNCDESKRKATPTQIKEAKRIHTELLEVCQKIPCSEMNTMECYFCCMKYRDSETGSCNSDKFLDIQSFNYAIKYDCCKVCFQAHLVPDKDIFLC